MPIYEYECKNCHEKFEFIVPLSDTQKWCPKCGKQLKKLISLSNFKLVGDGWYVTDYKNTKVNDEKEDSQSD